MGDQDPNAVWGAKAERWLADQADDGDAVAKAPLVAVIVAEASEEWATKPSKRWRDERGDEVTRKDNQITTRD